MSASDKVKVVFHVGDDVRFEGEFTPEEFLDFVTSPMLIGLDDGPPVWDKCDTPEGAQFLDDTTAWVQGAHSHILAQVAEAGRPGLYQ